MNGKIIQIMFISDRRLSGMAYTPMNDDTVRCFISVNFIFGHVIFGYAALKGLVIASELSDA